MYFKIFDTMFATRSVARLPTPVGGWRTSGALGARSEQVSERCVILPLYICFPPSLSLGVFGRSSGCSYNLTYISLLALTLQRNIQFVVLIIMSFL